MKITTRSGTPSKQKTADGKQLQPWLTIGDLATPALPAKF